MIKKYFTYQQIFLWALLWLGFAPVLVCAQSHPDIIYILSDDQAYTDYSFMGHQHIRTPNLDQLAKESRLFTRGYVPDSLCRPSLATIITGLYPHQHGIVGNDPPPASGWGAGKRPPYTAPAYQQQIERYFQLHIDRAETLPDRLKKLGYASYQTGKWWEGHPSRGGFDQAMTHGDLARGARHGDVGLEIGRNGMQVVENYVKQARSAGQPYFLWYAPCYLIRPTIHLHDCWTELNRLRLLNRSPNTGLCANGSTRRLVSSARSCDSTVGPTIR